MRKSTVPSFLIALPLAFALLFGLSACEEDPCEDAICAACPSSRVIIQYQDSTGACPADFSAAGNVVGFNLNTNVADLNYAFSDSCTASLLLRENYRYTVSSGTYSDEIEIIGFDFQEPVMVTECCLCYPASWVDLRINGDSTRVTYPDGEYDNQALVISIN